MMLHVLLMSMITMGFKEKVSSEKSIDWAYYPALFFKIIMGLLLGCIYHYYYGYGDTLLLFEDGATLAHVADQDFFHYLNILLSDQELSTALHYGQNPRALFFAKFISPVAWFTQGNYWLTSIYFSLLGFFCSWYLCLALVRYYRQALAVAVSFLFYPSAVFWSAGIIKECVAVGMVCLIVGMMLHIIHQKDVPTILDIFGLWGPNHGGTKSRSRLLGRCPHRPKCTAVWLKGSVRILALLFCGVILWQLKYYYAAVLFPLVISSMALYRLRIAFYQKTLMMTGACGLIVLMLSFLHPNLEASRILYALVSTHDMIFEASDAGNVIRYQSLEPTWQRVGYNFPLALVSGLFRPLPGDGYSLLHKVVQLENVLLLLSMVTALYCLVRYKKSIAEKQLFFAMLTYVMTLSALLALSSPNFGTLMRYKAVYLPFLVYMCALGCAPLLSRVAIRFGFCPETGDGKPETGGPVRNRRKLPIPDRRPANAV